MIRIIIADDHPIVRAGMKQIISEASDMMVADEASDGHQLLDKIRKEHFDTVVLDISMPHMDGLDVLKQLKIEKPKLPVIILSIYPESQYALRVLKAGASGKTVTEIAEDLVLSVKTISTYRSRILEKMGMQNSAELMHYAIQNQLVD
jgi:two-component system, NarL family, invasion response regulator UvrY